MIARLILEVVLALATCFAGAMFWQLQKRARFLKGVIRNQSYLEGFISLDALVNPPPRVLPFAQRNEVGYFLNIMAVNEADAASQRRPRMVFVLLLAPLLVASYFIGVPYLAINGALFFVLYFEPLSQSAQLNALEHVLTVAVILHRWRLENPIECDQWIEKAWSLRPLYEAVKAAQ